MTAIVSAGMAELASAYPVAGAQYYWSFMVSSDKYKPFAAYVNGWMSVLGWWLASASVCNFVASMVLAIVTLWYPGYQIQHWHQWLVYVGIVWLGVIINVFGSGFIPAFNKMIRRSSSSLRLLTFFVSVPTDRVIFPSHFGMRYSHSDFCYSSGLLPPSIPTSILYFWRHHQLHRLAKRWISFYSRNCKRGIRLPWYGLWSPSM